MLFCYFFLKKKEKLGSIDLFWEAVAGGIAGFCQVTVTSPMEVMISFYFSYFLKIFFKNSNFLKTDV